MPLKKHTETFMYVILFIGVIFAGLYIKNQNRIPTTLHQKDSTTYETYKQWGDSINKSHTTTVLTRDGKYFTSVNGHGDTVYTNIGSITTDDTLRAGKINITVDQGRVTSAVDSSTRGYHTEDFVLDMGDSIFWMDKHSHIIHSRKHNKPKWNITHTDTNIFDINRLETSYQKHPMIAGDFSNPVNNYVDTNYKWVFSDNGGVELVYIDPVTKKMWLPTHLVDSTYFTPELGYFSDGGAIIRPGRDKSFIIGQKTGFYPKQATYWDDSILHNMKVETIQDAIPDTIWVKGIILVSWDQHTAIGGDWPNKTTYTSMPFIVRGWQKKWFTEWSYVTQYVDDLKQPLDKSIIVWQFREQH